MSHLLTSENLIALCTLTGLEIVLGIDNIVFLSILVGKLPREQQPAARRLGLSLAMLARIALLLAISWVMHLTDPWFTLVRPWSGRDLILFCGGLFLIAKSTFEIHDKLEGPESSGAVGRKHASFGATIAQILALDLVFSLDSVITAVGMAQEVAVMIVAVVCAVLVMLVFAGAIGGFIERHPTMKMLALSFLLLIGVMLVVEGFGKHVEKGYIYFAMAFSLFVELLNLKLRKSGRPAALHGSSPTGGGEPGAH